MKSEALMKSFVTLNPAYYLKPDHNKALLLTFDSLRAEEDEHFEGVIHPLHAKILSMCRGGELDATIKNIAARLNLEEEMVGEFVRALYGNPQGLKLKFGPNVIEFPPRTLVNLPDSHHNNIYGPEDFTFSDFDCYIPFRNQPLTPSAYFYAIVPYLTLFGKVFILLSLCRMSYRKRLILLYYS